MLGRSGERSSLMQSAKNNPLLGDMFLLSCTSFVPQKVPSTIVIIYASF